MKVKIHPDYIGLCGSCRHASLAKTINGEFWARCEWFGYEIPEPIATCSKYDDRRLPSLYDMRRTAWILRTDQDQKVVGFVSNEKFRRSKEFLSNPCIADDDD
jgi:hypothetical protein